MTARSRYGSTTGRVAKVVWHLAIGGTVTPAEVARQLNISERGAYYLLCKASTTIPIYIDDDGKWRKVEQ
jgi:hypothetical protein